MAGVLLDPCCPLATGQRRLSQTPSTTRTSAIGQQGERERAREADARVIGAEVGELVISAII
jgi:hypothetical protein